MLAIGKNSIIAFTDTSDPPIHYYRDGTSQELPFTLNHMITQLSQNSQHNPDSKNKDCDQLDESKFNLSLIQLSPSERLLAICHSSKKLIIFETQTWTIQKVFVVDRKIAHILFVSNEKKIIVNNRSGDVFLFDLSSPNFSVGEFLLGHNSIILDIKLDLSERYLVTCDRDEKIRVSNYPNCYNILSYCLGHTEFVSSISFDKEVLISGGGDGVLRTWDFKNSRQIAAHSCHMDLNTDDKLAISKIHVLTSNLVAVTFFARNEIVVYNLHDSYFRLSHCETLTAKIINSYLFGHVLLVLIEDASDFFHGYTLKENSLEKNSLPFIESLSRSSKLIQNCINLSKQENDTNWLYKRSYANISEYHKRKKEREEDFSESKKKILE